MNYSAQASLARVFVDPYRLKPLTTIIINDGYIIEDANVSIQSLVPTANTDRRAYTQIIKTA